MESDQLELHTQRMRSQALDDFSSRIPFESVTKPYHRSTLKRAISNVLSTELSIFTFAQIIDGLPTADVAWDRRYPGLHYNNPVDEHEEVCPGCVEKAREFYQDWDPAILKFNPKVENT